jgi:1-acyl-sn-glycerol-3-phosphate acyltransferase
MQERNSNLRKVPPMMLRKVEQRDNPKEQTEIDKHVQFDQKSMYHRVRLTGVTPMHNVSRNNQSIAEARQYAREGGIIVVFPEGTTHPAQMDLRTVRTYSGVSEIAEPVTADQISQPVIPIFIKGSEKYAGVLGKGTDKVVIHIGSPQHRQYQQSQTAENALRESRQTRRSFRDRVWGEVVRMQEKYDPAVKHATA